MEDQWTAAWITSPVPLAGSGPMPIFRRSFNLDRVPGARRATLRLCGLGQFESRINGNKVGPDVLEPGWTDYRKTCLYVTHDVTSLILPGENVIGVLLGNGMYHVAGGRYRKFKGSFGPPKLIAELLIEFTDGSLQQIKSDTDWRTVAGPITFSCIYGGEDHDARQEPAGWDAPRFDDRGWHNAQRCDGPGGKLVPQRYAPIRVMQRFDAKATNDIAPGVRVFDLGQNMSGWPALTVRGEAGKTITLRTGEQVDAEGRVTQKNSGSPVTFSYTARSDSEETWHPRFSLTGFRYVEATGDIDVLKSVAGHFVHHSARVIGSFACSNEMLNRIHELILAAIRSNSHSVFTDCPHREKLGWLEQAHLMAPSILYNFDASPLYEKVLGDMRDAQHENGMVPTIAPQYTSFKAPWNVFNDSPEWGAACVLAPACVHSFTGADAILRANYDTMKHFVGYLGSRADEKGIVAYGLGDWYDIGPGDPGFSKLTSLGVTGTGTLIQCLDALASFADALAKPQEAEQFRQRSDLRRRDFNAAYFDVSARKYDRGSQCAQAMALALHIVEPQHRAQVLDVLVADIRTHDNHITAGDIGFRYVLQALAEAGRDDVVFDLLTQTTPPSYGAQLARGATTLTEAWDANPSKSLNHMMLGHAEEWFYHSLAGIQIDLAAGASQPQLRIAPSPVGDVTWVKAHHELPQGRVEVAWTRQGREFRLEATVPDGVRTKVVMPGAKEGMDVSAGRSSFRAEL